ncbi:MAG: hypothetical protein ACRDMA_17455 [Solirubrobacterales bacterium]
MTHKFERRDRLPALEEFRNELGDEFVRVARARSGLRGGQRLRRGGLAILAAAIVVPGAIAAERELGGSAARVPAPALSPQSTCPEEVQDFLRGVLAGEKTLSDYQQSPGYPVEGCPTVEEIQPILQEYLANPPGESSK